MPTKSSTVHQTATRLTDLLESKFIDEQGLMRYNLDTRTSKPFTNEALAQAQIALNSDHPTDRWSYEDTLFITGIYFWALTEQVLTTQDPQARQTADRLLDKLLPLIEQCNAIEPGFLGKPWGGRPNPDNITIDQTFYLCAGLFRYCEIADDDRKQQAARIVIDNTDWWIRNGYYNPGHLRTVPPCWLSRSHGPVTMTQVYLAYLLTNDEKYRQECERLNQQYATDAFIPRLNQWEGPGEDGMLIRRAALWHHSKALALWLLCRYWPQRKQQWQYHFVEQWFKELRLGLRDDGLAYMAVRVNSANQTENPFADNEMGYRPHPEFEELKRKNLTGWLWVSAARSGYFASHIAASAALMADSVPWMWEEARTAIHRVLHQLDEDDLTWAYKDDAHLLPPNKAHYCVSLSSKAITPWLLSYWASRRLGLLLPDDE